jgi:hypothetical protein
MNSPWHDATRKPPQFWLLRQVTGVASLLQRPWQEAPKIPGGDQSALRPGLQPVASDCSARLGCCGAPARPCPPFARLSAKAPRCSPGPRCPFSQASPACQPKSDRGQRYRSVAAALAQLPGLFSQRPRSVPASSRPLLSGAVFFPPGLPLPHNLFSLPPNPTSPCCVPTTTAATNRDTPVVRLSSSTDQHRAASNFQHAACHVSFRTLPTGLNSQAKNVGRPRYGAASGRCLCALP